MRTKNPIWRKQLVCLCFLSSPHLKWLHKGLHCDHQTWTPPREGKFRYSTIHSPPLSAFSLRNELMSNEYQCAGCTDPSSLPVVKTYRSVLTNNPSQAGARVIYRPSPQNHNPVEVRRHRRRTREWEISQLRCHRPAVGEALRARRNHKT